MSAVSIPTSLTGAYTVDPTHSRIGFVARYTMVTKARGSFNQFEGSGHFDAERPENSTARLTIKATSIDTRNGDRDAHLRSNDYLDMENYLEITFVSTGPLPSEGRGDEVEEAGLDSFPASDSPTWWAGPAGPPGTVPAPPGREGVAMVRPSIQVRRVYEASGVADGFRVLVDRLWPRGVSKEAAGLTEWCKQAAPSTELRRWYAHDRRRFEEFRRRYRDELRSPESAQAVEHLRQLAARSSLVLVTATKDLDISAASVLAEVLRDEALPAAPPSSGSSETTA